jgi:hypothetical protein
VGWIPFPYGVQTLHGNEGLTEEGVLRCRLPGLERSHYLSTSFSAFSDINYLFITSLASCILSFRPYINQLGLTNNRYIRNKNMKQIRNNVNYSNKRSNMWESACACDHQI